MGHEDTHVKTHKKHNNEYAQTRISVYFVAV